MKYEDCKTCIHLIGSNNICDIEQCSIEFILTCQKEKRKDAKENTKTKKRIL